MNFMNVCDFPQDFHGCVSLSQNEGVIPKNHEKDMFWIHSSMCVSRHLIFPHDRPHVDIIPSKLWAFEFDRGSNHNLEIIYFS